MVVQNGDESHGTIHKQITQKKNKSKSSHYTPTANCRPNTVDGRNLANQLVGSLSHYLRGFIHARWLFGISEPSTVSQGSFQKKQFTVSTSYSYRCIFLRPCITPNALWGFLSQPLTSPWIWRTNNNKDLFQKNQSLDIRLFIRNISFDMSKKHSNVWYICLHEWLFFK